MLIQTKHILTMLVVAGISMAALPTKAATTYTAGDLLVGFRATAGSASSATTTTLVFNLGSATTIRDQNSASLALGNIGSELTNVFGSDWASNASLTWAAAGIRSATAPALDLSVVDGDPTQALYLTQANTSGTVGVYGSGTLNITGGGTGMTNTSIDALGFANSFKSYVGDTTQNGLAAAIPYGINTFEDYTSAGSDFRSGKNLDVAVNTAGGRILDLYRILGTTTGASPTGTLRTGAWQGTLSLGTDGAISFDPVAVEAVPEPSRALLAAGGLAALAFRRRRRQA